MYLRMDSETRLNQRVTKVSQLATDVSLQFFRKKKKYEHCLLILNQDERKINESNTRVGSFCSKFHTTANMEIFMSCWIHKHFCLCCEYSLILPGAEMMYTPGNIFFVDFDMGGGRRGVGCGESST